MPSIGLSNLLGNLPVASQTASTVKAAPRPQDDSNTGSRATLKPDTVRLSMAGQAKLLHQQGTSAAQIASSLGIKVADVEGYLGVRLPSTPVPVQTPAQPQPAAQAEAPRAAPPATSTAQPAVTELPSTKS